MKKAFYLALVSFCSAAFALQGGPTQPDYAQFEPSGMQDMVSMQSGDFSYQIPLSDIPSPYGNYPLSLSYHAGISPQQEASWVGLGWSLNPGSISRDVRGVPDDQIHGGTLGFIYQYSSTQVWSVDLGFSVGIFSVGQNFSSDGSVGFSATVGPKIAGVVGVGFTVGTDAVGLSASVGNQAASLNASLMFSTTNGKANASVGAKLSMGGASLGAQVSTGSGASVNVGFGNSTAGVGLSVSSNGVSASAHAGSVSMSKSKNGSSISVGGGTLSVSNSTSKGKNKTSTAGFAIVVPTQIGVFSFGFSQTTFEYWMRSATSEYLYGYLYQAGPAINRREKNPYKMLPENSASFRKSNGEIPWKWVMKGRNLESIGGNEMVPAYDMYSVSSEGASGSFRPFAREKHQLYKLLSNGKTDGEKSIESYTELLNTCGDGWQCENEFLLKSADEKIENTSYMDYKECVLDPADTCSIYGMFETNFRNNGNRLVFDSKEGEYVERSGMQFLFVGEGSGYYESENVNGGKNRPLNSVYNKLLRHRVNGYDYALYGSKKVQPIFEDNSPTGKLEGFVVTTADGSKYYFKQSVRSYFKVDYTINKEKGLPIFMDKSTDKNDGFIHNLLEGVAAIAKWGFEQLNPINTMMNVYDFVFKSGTLNENCKVDGSDNSSDYFYSYSVNMNPHATQWLLTEIRGADYVLLDSANGESVGYNVKFSYSKPTIYHWRTPYSRPNMDASQVLNFRSPRNAFTPAGCDSRKYQASFGVKEYVYLESIETSTHKVEFKLNNVERADGKGWEHQGTSFPVLVQASIAYEYDSSADTTMEDARVYTKVKPKSIYFNSPLPEKVLQSLYATRKIHVYGLSTNKDPIDKNSKEGEYHVTVHREDSVFYIKNDSYAATQGDESAFGLYKLDLDGGNEADLTYMKSFDDSSFLVLGESAKESMKQNSYIDWSEFILSPSTNDPFENQMRYLTKISYYNKGQSDPYREYTFDYDYSLQPKTLNSYCKGRYPANTSEVSSSPDAASVDVCSSAGSNALYGKLTLKSITEKGCQNGRCASLPPFKFSYNSPSASTARISTNDGWKDYFQINLGEEQDVDSLYKDGYFADFSDIDATILASESTTDEYGFWSNTANVENHKVDQAFADFGAAAWSLNKVVDPAGGNLEVEYERDTYANGVDYSDEKRTAEFNEYKPCRNYGIYYVGGKNVGDNLCLNIKPLYWREQCLGPRAAFWDSKKPMGYTGGDYDYLDSIEAKVETSIFFNLSSQMKTKVKCGMFGWGKCSRTRSVALVGDGKILDIRSDAGAKNIVLDRSWLSIKSGLEKAAKKINDSQSWKLEDPQNGYFWTGKQYSTGFKAGDLRVSRLTRHDIGLKSQTIYEYGDGEMAQLPDSAYTTVLGSRFYSNKISTAIPDVHLNPMSRIVGFNDDDLMFLPGARITYPKVTVRNTSEGSNESNGSTEFYYVTPETGIPENFIDQSTRDSLVPFVKVNLLEVSNSYVKKADVYSGRVINVSLVDDDNGVKPLSRQIVIFPEKPVSLFFYSNDIKKYDQVQISFVLPSRNGIKLNQSLTELTKFNEISLAMSVPALDDGVDKDNDGGYHIYPIWQRHQKEGYYPILYKQVDYVTEKIPNLPFDDDDDDDYKFSVSADFESSITYRDLTAFLGQNYKTVFYRGDDRKIITKVDSSVYSTKIPDMLEGVVEGAQDDETLGKVGKQVERWSSEINMRCYEDSVLSLKGKEDVCRDGYTELYMKGSANSKTHKEYTYIRYPAFQIGSVSYTGHDNQEQFVNSSNSNWSWSSSSTKFGVTELRNYRYDPIMGSPTATVAISRVGQNLLARKITQTTPAYAANRANSSSSASLSDEMFLRNMFTQNYLEEVFTDTVNVNGKTLNLDESKLRSFSISPYQKLPTSLFGISSSSRTPIVAMGTFKNKAAPLNIRSTALDYLDANALTPNIVSDYNGTIIKSLNKQMKVLETEDVLHRVQSTIFSTDAMFQLSLFFPASKEDVAVVLPYKDEVFASKGCSVSGTSSVKNGDIVASSNLTISCSLPSSSSSSNSTLVAEYREMIGGNWVTKREKLSGRTMSLTLSGGWRLNYLRIYPDNAESKTFIYDVYGNMIQSIAEDNTSTYYEYDTFGKLVQSRNDDGVSFKSHHREYMNSDMNAVGK